jgi:putative transposase
MSREVFQSIIERQRRSGLTVKGFCRNEAYSTASFYYWKRKFSTPYTNSFPAQKNLTEGFAQVRFPAAKSECTPSTSGDMSKELHEIMIELPGNIKIHFRGSNESEVAMRLITQIYSDHVLSD